MKDKELLEFFIGLAEKQGIKEKYMLEYVHSSSLMNKEHALEEYKHANMKCCDIVRLYKINSVNCIELVKEKS